MWTGGTFSPHHECVASADTRCCNAHKPASATFPWSASLHDLFRTWDPSQGGERKTRCPPLCYSFWAIGTSLVPNKQGFGKPSVLHQRVRVCLWVVKHGDSIHQHSLWKMLARRQRASFLWVLSQMRPLLGGDDTYLTLAPCLRLAGIRSTVLHGCSPGLHNALNKAGTPARPSPKGEGRTRRLYSGKNTLTHSGSRRAREERRGKQSSWWWCLEGHVKLH